MLEEYKVRLNNFIACDDIIISKNFSTLKLGERVYTSFCRLAAKASNSSIRRLDTCNSCSLSECFWLTRPVMHLNGEPEALVLTGVFSVLFAAEAAREARCSASQAMASKALYCSPDKTQKTH